MAIFYPPTPRGIAELAWDSLGKRKREYDMAKRSFTKKRRLVTYKGRRRARRRSTYRPKMMSKSNYGYGISGNFYRNKRKPSIRSYRRKLYNGTQEDRHYRALDAKTGALNTQASYTLKTWQNVPFIPDLFYQTPILQKQSTEPDREFDRWITIRGGMSTLTFKNQGTDAMRIEVYSVWMKQHKAGAYPPESTNGDEITNIAVDPYTFEGEGTLGTAAGKEYVIKKRRFTLLEAGAVWTIMDKLPVQRVEIGNYSGTTTDNSNDHRMYYWFCIDTPGDNTSGRLDWVRTASLSFSADVVNIGA